MTKNHEQRRLEPPMQLAQGALFSAPFLPVPQFRFALAELIMAETDEEFSDEQPQEPELRLRISHAIPVVAPPEHSFDDDEDTYVENVEQTYTVSIPYTKQIDGKDVPSFRTETRKRMVPVRRKKSAAVVSSGKPLVKQSYTICVPYTEHVPLSDGTMMTVVRTRTETRTRMVDPDAPSPKLMPQMIINDYRIELTRCFYPRGAELGEAEKLQRFATPVPVLVIDGAEAITPYFSGLLRDDAIFVVEPGS